MILRMSKEILIRLTPLEPYFLGSDRTFHYGEKDVRRIGKSDYFIKSEKIPSQTTIFGVLRYLGLQDRTVDYDLGDSALNIGTSSFQFAYDSQEFGKIKKISPLFIMHSNPDRVYVRTPFNHIKSSANTSSAGNICFSPFSEFTKLTFTNGDICEEQIIPLDYKAKDWLSDSFMDIDNGEIMESSELFFEREYTGIDINKDKEAFFKMQFVELKEGYSFAFCAVLDDDFPEITDKIVYMGRRKSAFAVTAEQPGELSWNKCREAIEESIEKSIGNDGQPFCYFASDTYFRNTSKENPIESLLGHCRFSVIQTKTLREYRTNYYTISQKDRFEKSSELFRLIRAGSVIYPKDGHMPAIENIVKNNHFSTIGMNCII